MGKKRHKNNTSNFQQMLEYINDQSLRIKRVSRDFFMGADIGTRRHKDKNKYSRRVKHKKDYSEDI